MVKVTENPKKEKFEVTAHELNMLYILKNSFEYHEYLEAFKEISLFYTDVLVSQYRECKIQNAEKVASSINLILNFLDGMNEIGKE